jgi:IclR family acetate operon transcriptional repressor
LKGFVKKDILYILETSVLVIVILFAISCCEINKEANILTSVAKALKIITRLSNPPHEMRLTDISDHLQMSKSATYQILRELEISNLVSRDPKTKLYHLGPSLLRLGYVYDQIKGLKEICMPILQVIADSTGCTCYVSIREGIHGFLAYKVDSIQSSSTIYRETMGTIVSFNCGSTGKLLAAHLPERDIQILLAEGLEKRASMSITDKGDLLKEFAKIREQGYSTSIRENSEQFWGISTPIYDKYNEVVAALGIVCTTETFSEEIKNKFLLVLKDHSRIISSQLQFK